MMVAKNNTNTYISLIDKFFSITEKCLGIVIWSFLLILVIWGIYYNSSLSKNGKTTEGIVIEIEKAGKTDTFDYEYIVSNKVFIGHCSLGGMSYKIEIGDTIEILYDSTKPSRSRPVDWSNWHWLKLLN